MVDGWNNLPVCVRERSFVHSLFIIFNFQRFPFPTRALALQIFVFFIFPLSTSNLISSHLISTIDVTRHTMSIPARLAFLNFNSLHRSRSIRLAALNLHKFDLHLILYPKDSVISVLFPSSNVFLLLSFAPPQGKMIVTTTTNFLKLYI